MCIILFVIHRQEKWKDNPTESVINSVLEPKSKALKESSIRGYIVEQTIFFKCLDGKGILTYDIKKINRSILMDYLDDCLMSTSARSRNNEMTVLSSVFSKILNRGLIEAYPILEHQKIKNTL